MTQKDETSELFGSCTHSVNIQTNFSDRSISGYSEIIFHDCFISQPIIYFQSPSPVYCTIEGIQINNISISDWTITPAALIEDAESLVNPNVYDMESYKMAYGYCSNTYGEKHQDSANFVENSLNIPTPESFEQDLNKKEPCNLNIRIYFKLSSNLPQSPLVYIRTNNSDFMFISDLGESKSSWFPTLSTSTYLTGDYSPFWKISWKFSCEVPESYTAILPGTLENIENSNNTLSNTQTKILSYYYKTCSNFPCMYPNDVYLMIGRFKEDVQQGIYTIRLYTPLNWNCSLTPNFIQNILENFNLILNSNLTMSSVSIVLSPLYNYYKPMTNWEANWSCLSWSHPASRLIPPYDSFQRYFPNFHSLYYTCHTKSNIIILPIELFNETSSYHIFGDFRIQSKILSDPILLLLECLASLWFGSTIHIINKKRKPSDSWLLIALRKYLVRKYAEKVLGYDLVKVKVRESLERCLEFIEVGSDCIPLSVDDFEIVLDENTCQGYPLMHWDNWEKHPLFHIKADLVFNSLEFYVKGILDGKAQQVGVMNLETWQDESQGYSKLFHNYIQSFISKYGFRKNCKNFTTQHFFSHLVSVIFQQFVHKSKREIANSQISQHEQYLLSDIQDDLNSFRLAWIEGVGCPNLTITSAIQFTNKSKSMESINILIDQTPLQPPNMTSKNGVSSFIPLISVYRFRSTQYEELFENKFDYEDILQPSDFILNDEDYTFKNSRTHKLKDSKYASDKSSRDTNHKDVFLSNNQSKHLGNFHNSIIEASSTLLAYMTDTENNENTQKISCIPNWIPSFIWPFDPNNFIYRESSLTVLGLGYVGRLQLPILFGMGPLYDSLYTKFNPILKDKTLNDSQFGTNIVDHRFGGPKQNTKASNIKLIDNSNNSPPITNGSSKPVNNNLSISANFPVAINGSFNAWQLGYINALLYIYSYSNEKYKSKFDQNQDLKDFDTDFALKWLCNEISTCLPKSVGSGRFWPGLVSISFIQSEEIKQREFELKEPQLPMIQEVRLDTLKGRSSGKKDTTTPSVSTASTNPGSSVPNSINKPALTRVGDIPRVSLLQHLQQQKRFVGKLSNSDNIWMRNIQRVSIDTNCSFNIINKSLIWTLVDPNQYWIARIHRSQTWSMWDQQFLNETSVVGHWEAAFNLGRERLKHKLGNELIIHERALKILNLLMNGLYRFDWNIVVRQRIILSLIQLHNKFGSNSDFSRQSSVIQDGVITFFRRYIDDINGIISQIETCKTEFKNNQNSENSKSKDSGTMNIQDTSSDDTEICKENSIQIFIAIEKTLLHFLFKSLALMWDSCSNSSNIRAIHLLIEQLEFSINSKNKDKWRDTVHILMGIEKLAIIERGIQNYFKLCKESHINKLVDILGSVILEDLSFYNSHKYYYKSSLIGLSFRIFAKHSTVLIPILINDFRSRFGTHLDFLWYIPLQFCNYNKWWKYQASLQGNLDIPLYILSSSDEVVYQALRSFFYVSLQGIIDTLAVFNSNEKSNSVIFKQITPLMIHQLIHSTFRNTYFSNVEYLIEDSYTFKMCLGIYSTWKVAQINLNSFQASISFPSNFLKTLSICCFIHLKLVDTFYFKESECNINGDLNLSKYPEMKYIRKQTSSWRILSFLWSAFADAFDSIIHDFPSFLDQFTLVQISGEFEPLIRSISESSNLNSNLNQKSIYIIKQCSIFISQIILNSPITVSCRCFNSSIVQDISQIYMILFGSGVPVCMTKANPQDIDTEISKLQFDDIMGYIKILTPETPLREIVRKYQRFLRRGCELSDSVQIRRLCDDEHYVISRGWKHMCKKITQCLVEFPYSGPFMYPVDENEAPGYYDLITQPMDLSTVVNKIKEDSYSSIDEYKEDVDLVFRNCRKYNESTSDIVEWCNKIQSEFESLINPVLKYFQQNKKTKLSPL
ncbi:bromodomain-containing protein [Cryptosporidium andersoni]|uniref:Bromodomain-containing protein n=1 Tax=Cryptosporidium andersoni TaxID=117008 RepID=A0A1J4MNA8_9CRYT|nr:bromodomain-containing protein [Cryptosporidium andersoni]